MKHIEQESSMPEAKCSLLPHLRKHQSGGKKIQQRPQCRLIHAGQRRYAQCELGWPRYAGSPRYWQAFFGRPPPNMLVQLISAFKGGRGINLYFST
jgi:hypothetical protein